MQGLALILVVSILAIAAIMAVSFVFTMRMEYKAAVNYQYGLKANYLAEAGVAHARAVLKSDKQDNNTDSFEDKWWSQFYGGDVDNDGDGNPDSRWFYIYDQEGKVMGRYAVLVQDEAGKLNLNTSGWHNTSPLYITQGYSTFEVSLEKFLGNLGIDNAQNLATEIIEYRWGQDKMPGIKDIDDDNDKSQVESDGLDNDADGLIDESKEGVDEPDEFNPQLTMGDDRPFLTVEDIKKIASIEEETFEKIKNFVTVYSQDREITSRGGPRYNINSANPEEIFRILLENGTNYPWTKAVNITDFIDSDQSASKVVKSSRRIYTANIGPQGGWSWQVDHYENDEPGSSSGTWTWWVNIPDGEYYCLIYGSERGQDIGDVTIGGFTQKNMDDGDVFIATPTRKVTIEGGIFSISIANNESAGTTTYFKYVELSSLVPVPGLTSSEVWGIEAVRINEIMVKPVITLSVSQDQQPGGDWVWTGSLYQNSNAGGGPSGQGTWVFSGIPDGDYYMSLFAASPGQDIGDVEAEGLWQDKMDHGDRFTKRETVTVSGGRLYISIQNNESEGTTCYFKSVQLSQQPDGEYIELVNISPREVDLSGWLIEGPGPEGWPAFIPDGTFIGPYQYLCLAVDKSDAAGGISGNGISLESIWGGIPSVQLNFSKSVDTLSDLLKDSPISNTDFVILKDAQGHIVDKVEYTAAQLEEYVSLERGDPSLNLDTNGNGIFDGWLPCEDLAGATPGFKNKNSGMTEIDEITGEPLEHDITELKVKDGPLGGLGDLVDISDGRPWGKISLQDIEKMADAFAFKGLILQAEDHKVEGGWTEEAQEPPLTSWFASSAFDEEAVFSWNETDGLQNGVYYLSIYGREGEAISISLRLAQGDWSAFTPALTPREGGRIFLGLVEIGTDSIISCPDRTLEIKIKNKSTTGNAHFDFLELSPIKYIGGRININTASKEVLSALPGIDSELAQEIINGRPYGNKDWLNRGIGDILVVLGDTDAERIEYFKPISNLITVSSDVYRIVVTGQALRGNEVVAEKKIWAIVERE
jgi:type II secretory pathway component PulK